MEVYLETVALNEKKKKNIDMLMELRELAGESPVCLA